jgi:hypothetical protein
VRRSHVRQLSGVLASASESSESFGDAVSALHRLQKLLIAHTLVHFGFRGGLIDQIHMLHGGGEICDLRSCEYHPLGTSMDVGFKEVFNKASEGIEADFDRLHAASLIHQAGRALRPLVFHDAGNVPLNDVEVLQVHMVIR